MVSTSSEPSAAALKARTQIRRNTLTHALSGGGFGSELLHSNICRLTYLAHPATLHFGWFAAMRAHAHTGIHTQTLEGAALPAYTLPVRLTRSLIRYPS